MTDRPRGDDHISGLDMRLWSLVQHVLHTWNTLVIFNKMGYVVPVEMGGPMRGWVNFLVPVDSKHKDDIIAFLERELADLQTKDWVLKGTTMPGTDVLVSTNPFSGLQPYVTVEHSKEITNTFVRDMLSRMRREGKETSV
jgi:hypothetical protein